MTVFVFLALAFLIRSGLVSAVPRLPIGIIVDAASGSDTSQGNVTRLPSNGTNTNLTTGFNCSSLISKPPANWYVNSTIVHKRQKDTKTVVVDGRASCVNAAQMVCDNFTASSQQGSWTNATYGGCWVGIFVPSTAKTLPSSDRCTQQIFGPMIDTCINQTLVDEHQPYDEASYNISPHNTVVKGGWEYDKNWPSYLVMSTNESAALSSNPNFTEALHG
ncbi:hypothetical protein MMC12_004325 [Toensbergia leucococca]|nr:hypothetical protein [Toensbergia leucococca]